MIMFMVIMVMIKRPRLVVQESRCCPFNKAKTWAQNLSLLP